MFRQLQQNKQLVLPKDILSWENLEKVADFSYLEDKHNLDQKNKIFVYLTFLINGLGAYARENFAAGDIIGPYTGIITHHCNPESKYTTNFTKDIFIDALKKGNYLRFFNHSQYQYNCVFNDEFINGEWIIVCRAITHIRAGQQFLINYEIDEKFYSLHPDDNWLSAQKILEENKTFYQAHVISNQLPSLNLNINDLIHISKIGIDIFLSKDLSNMSPTMEDIHGLNNRFIKVNQKNMKPYEFNEWDTINALMLSAYFAQLTNITWLIDKKADINRQQTVSGQTALFFTIKGFADKQCGEQACLDAILFLINHGANFLIRDIDEETFLYSAIKYLSKKSIKEIIDLLIQKQPDVVKILLGMPNNKDDDNEDEDLVYYAIKNKRIDAFQLILEYYPDYAKIYLNPESPDCYYAPEDITEIVSDYSPTEKTNLHAALIDSGLNVEIVNEIFLNNKSESSKKCDEMPLPSQPKKIYGARLVDRRYGSTITIKTEYTMSYDNWRENRLGDKKLGLLLYDWNNKKLATEEETKKILAMHPESRKQFYPDITFIFEADIKNDIHVYNALSHVTPIKFNTLRKGGNYKQSRNYKKRANTNLEGPKEKKIKIATETPTKTEPLPDVKKQEVFTPSYLTPASNCLTSASSSMFAQTYEAILARRNRLQTVSTNNNQTSKKI